jgi:hypothetical protein
VPWLTGGEGKGGTSRKRNGLWLIHNKERLMTDSYYGMKSLMEPEGWPSAVVHNKSRAGAKCNQRLEDKERKRRLDAYRKLAEKEMPLP